MRPVYNMMRILGLRCPAVINEKPVSFLGEGGVPRWRKYAIFSYFLCGTLGIWKKACPFISGTKGSGQGHVGLEVNTFRCFSQSWRRWRSHCPELFAWMPPVYGGLPIGWARGWHLSAGYPPFCRHSGSCVPVLSLARCANICKMAGDPGSLKAGDSGTESRTGLCSSLKERHWTTTLSGLPSSQEAFPGRTGWLTCWLFVDITSLLV